MTFTRLASVVAACTLVVTVAATARPLAATAAPSTLGEMYFGCPGAHIFQSSGNLVRCYRPGQTVTADFICPMNWVKALDQFSGNRDACQYKLTNAIGNYTCPAGYSPKVQPGPDMCAKETAPSIVPPTEPRTI